MSESFAELLQSSLNNLNMQPGMVVKAEVVDIEDQYVIVNAGLKSEAIIPIEEFYNDTKDSIEIKIGDMVEVALEAVEDGHGATRLSREKAKRFQSWVELEDAYQNKEVIMGMITGRVKGGFTVEVKSLRAFLPGSLLDVTPLKDTTELENKPIELKVIKIDRKKNNIVVSRRAVVDDISSTEKQALLEKLEEGVEVDGIVKNLTDYGAFIDLGGVDGLLHVTDMSWQRIKHPSEIVSVGDKIKVKVIKHDKDKGRVSLGIKQLGEDPWVDLHRRYPTGKKVFGKITNITDYGCFVEIEKGVEGLVHMSELSWTNKNIHPSKVVQLEQEVEVLILDVDEDNRRISLGLKQCTSNPWQSFSETHQTGDKISGKIKSITDFGIFIGLDGDIDGLIHLSDISWNESGEEVVRNYKRGDEVEAVVLSVDSDRERVSLGIKQLQKDEFSEYTSESPKGTIVTGEVVEVDSKRALVRLSDDVTAVLKAGDISATERVTDAKNALKVGDKVEAKIVSVDKKDRQVTISIKAKETQEEKEALREHTKNTKADKTIKKTLGDLLKAQMNKAKENE